MKCGVCKKAWYCSSAHQQQDWPTHKKDSCDKLRVQANEEAHAREKYASQMKGLVEKYAEGENNLWLVLDTTIKALGPVESKKSLYRLGYDQIQQKQNFERLDQEAQDRITKTSDLLKQYLQNFIQFEINSFEQIPVLMSKEQMFRGHIENLQSQQRNFLKQFQKTPDLSGSESGDQTQIQIECELIEIQEKTNKNLELALQQQSKVFEEQIDACVDKIARLGEIKLACSKFRDLLEKENQKLLVIS